jgi:hypothetical protein
MDLWIDDYNGGWNYAETIVLQIIDNARELTHYAFCVQDVK